MTLGWFVCGREQGPDCLLHMAVYDEDLLKNPFYVALERQRPDLCSRAAEVHGVVSVTPPLPRPGGCGICSVSSAAVKLSSVCRFWCRVAAAWGSAASQTHTLTVMSCSRWRTGSRRWTERSVVVRLTLALWLEWRN